MRPCCPSPFGRNRDKAVDEFLQPMFGFDVADDLSDFVQDSGIEVLAHSHKAGKTVFSLRNEHGRWPIRNHCSARRNHALAHHAGCSIQ